MQQRRSFCYHRTTSTQLVSSTYAAAASPRWHARALAIPSLTASNANRNVSAYATKDPSALNRVQSARCTGSWSPRHSQRTSHNSSNRLVPAAAATNNNGEPDMLLLRMLGLTTMRSRNNNSSSTTTGSSSSTKPPPANHLRQGIINPNHPLYKAWRGLLIGAAAFTGLFIPWELGFGGVEHMYSLDNAATWVDITLVALFMCDIAVSHCVAYETDELLVDEPGAIAANYRRQRLALDLISAVPFDWIAYAAAAAFAAAALSSSSVNGIDAAAAATGDALAAVAAGGSAATAAAAAAAATSGVTHAAVGSAAAAATASGVTAVEAAAASSSSVLPAIACLKGLHLVRLYRVRWFFRYLEYDLSVSLLTVTVARNLVIVMYLTHWVACGFEGLARSGGYDPDLLVGLNPELFASISQPEQYVYSLYWSVTTLAGNEWNGMDSVQHMTQVVANTARASVFLLFNIALGAYILGTITLLVVKNDERTGRYRDLSSNLKTYSTLNQLPTELKDQMQEHLRLKFNNQEASDDQVLSIYPTTIRRRILRHLYLRHLRASYLFRGTPRKFLDALLSASRLELFRPGVDLLAAGDAVNELFVVVAGRVELRSPLDPSVSQYDWGGDYTDSLTSLDPLKSMMGEYDLDHTAAAAAAGGLHMYAGSGKVLQAGELFGEISFFTEIPQMETVRSLSTVRVMVITRSAFESIERSFPIASRLVLENLRRHSEAQVAVEFPGIASSSSSSSRAELQQLLASCPGSLIYSWASPELVELLMSNPSAVNKQANRSGHEITSSSLDSSSSSGSWDSRLPSPGNSVDAAAAVATHSLLNDQLQHTASNSGSSSSNACLRSVPGSSWHGQGLSARQELVLSNLVRVMAVINQHVAKQEEDRTTDFLYAATRGDTVKLRSMLQQGFNPDSADYDGRTALMLACVRGHRDVVDLLLAAGADATLDDNLGRSALLEACYHGHDSVIDTLVAAGVRLTPTCRAGSSSSSSSSNNNIRLSISVGARSNSGRSSSGLTAAGSLSAHTMPGSSSSSGGSSGGSSSGGGSSSSSCGGSSASWTLQLASLLCNCVYECNLPLLRRLLRAGAPVDIGDYDKRTALHISAAEGNTVMVRVLIEEGGASIAVQDRWGNTPLDEATRVGATMVVRYLQEAAAQQQQQQQQQQCEGQNASSTTTHARLQQQQQNAAAESAHTVKSVQDLQQQQQLQQRRGEAEIDLKHQVRQARREVQRGSRTVSQHKVEAVGKLLLLADQAQKALKIKADQIEAELAAAVQANADQKSRISSSSGGYITEAVRTTADQIPSEVDADQRMVHMNRDSTACPEADNAAAADDDDVHALDPMGKPSSSSSSSGSSTDVINSSTCKVLGNNVVSAVRLQKNKSGKPAAIATNITNSNGA